MCRKSNSTAQYRHSGSICAFFFHHGWCFGRERIISASLKKIHSPRISKQAPLNITQCWIHCIFISNYLLQITLIDQEFRFDWPLNSTSTWIAPYCSILKNVNLNLSPGMKQKLFYNSNVLSACCDIPVFLFVCQISENKTFACKNTSLSAMHKR